MPRSLAMATALVVMSGLLADDVSQAQSRKTWHSTTLTPYGGDQDQPSFSPNGKQIVFTWAKERGGDTDIYVQDVGGGTPKRLTTNPAADIAPAWSRDGKQIAFVRTRGAGMPAAVYLVAPNGGPERKFADVLLQTPNPRTVISWLRDGLTVAIAERDIAGHMNGISVIRTDNTNHPAVVGGPLDDVEFKEPPRSLLARLFTFPDKPGPAGTYTYPAVSPDGDFIAYAICKVTTCSLGVTALQASEDSYGRWDAYDWQSDLWRRRPVREADTDLRGIAWAPDSRSVIYAADTRGTPALWRIYPRSQAPEPIDVGGHPAWSPALSRKGHNLVFVSRVDPASDAHLMLVQNFR